MPGRGSPSFARTAAGLWTKQGVGVVVAQDPAQAGEGVPTEPVGQLILPHLPQGEGTAGGRAQGVGVVVAPRLGGSG